MELGVALEDHKKREELYATWLRAYKSKPKEEVKMFPWPGASNVVIPLVGITVDALSARLQRSIFAPKDLVETQIKAPAWENGEKEFRDWLSNFFETDPGGNSSGARDGLRTAAFDMPCYGDAYIKPSWVEETRKYHEYVGNVLTEVPVTGFRGVKWDVIPPDDVITPRGFDSWGQLPWVSHRLRYSVSDIASMQSMSGYRNLDTLKNFKKDRDSKAYLEREKAQGKKNAPTETPSAMEVHEIWGIWEITAEAGQASEFVECILTYSFDADVFIRAIHNPFFGRQRHIVKIPFLHQAHELYGLSASELALQFQEAASTIHNQVMDAGTASNAGIVAVSTESNIQANEEIYPGKKIFTPKPKEDIAVYHLNQPAGELFQMHREYAYICGKRTGVSDYSLGAESDVVGSRATATGTVSLINEGNIRFWVSIDDMRRSVEQLLYLTISLYQQMAPEGVAWAEGRLLKFPQGDPRTTLGLKLTITNEAVSRELEIQNLQLLMQVVNEYYSRLAQASAIIMNPQWPADQKKVIIQIMNSSHELVRKFVERFDIESLDVIVPNLIDMLRGTQQNGPGAMETMSRGLPQGVPPQPGIGPGASAPADANGGGNLGTPPAPGGSPLLVQ